MTLVELLDKFLLMYLFDINNRSLAKTALKPIDQPDITKCYNTDINIKIRDLQRIANTKKRRKLSQQTGKRTKIPTGLDTNRKSGNISYAFSLRLLKLL